MKDGGNLLTYLLTVQDVDVWKNYSIISQERFKVGKLRRVLKGGG